MAGGFKSAGVPAVAASTDLVHPLRQAVMDAVCHAIGSEGVEILVDRNYETLDYRLILRVKRYNRRFTKEVGIGYMDIEEAMRVGNAGDIVGHAVGLLVHDMISAFTEHLKKLGLR